MQCRICGTDRQVIFRSTHQWFMCDLCHLSSVAPISYKDFNSRYWSSVDDIPLITRNEFYSDYKSSGLTFETYRHRTSEKA